MKKNYEEKMIDEVLHFRNSKTQIWQPISNPLPDVRFIHAEAKMPDTFQPYLSPAAPEKIDVRDNSVLHY